MSKIVIAGCPNCPHFAHIELLADAIEQKLPDCQVRKIVIDPEKWKLYVWELCYNEKWNRPKTGAVIAWREPIAFGHRRLLIGDANDFQEFCFEYYGITLDLNSCSKLRNAKVNEVELSKVNKEKADNLRKAPPVVNVTLTNASSHIAYVLLTSLLNGYAIGHNAHINLSLFEPCLDLAMAIGKEVEDCASNVVRSLRITSDTKEAFAEADIIVFLDEQWQESGENVEQMKSRLWSRYHCMGSMFDWLVKPTVRILIGATTNGSFRGNFVASALATGFNLQPSIRDRVHSCANIVDGFCKAAISEKLNISSGQLTDLVVIGERVVPGYFYVHLDKARVHTTEKSAIFGVKEHWEPLQPLLTNRKWLQDEFIEKVVSRNTGVGAAVVHGTFTVSSALSDILRYLHGAGDVNHISSLGVRSKGWFGVPEGVMFYMPVRYAMTGEWEIVEDLKLSDEKLNLLQSIAQKVQLEYQRFQDPIALYQLNDGQPNTRGEPELLEASGVESPVGEYEEQSDEEDEVDIGDLHVD